MRDADGTQYLSVLLRDAGATSSTESNCITLSVDATLDGRPFTDIEPGHWSSGSSPLDGPGCVAPSFTVRSIPPGSTSIEISDATATISIALPDLAATRSIGLATPTPSFHAGDTLAFAVVGAPTDTGEVAELGATTPKAMAVDPATQEYCGLSMFDTVVKPVGGAVDFTVPDIYAQWGQGACDYVLVKGQAAPVDFDLTLVVSPLISRCDGATCTASLETKSAPTSAYAP